MGISTRAISNIDQKSNHHLKFLGWVGVGGVGMGGVGWAGLEWVGGVMRREDLLVQGLSEPFGPMMPWPSRARGAHGCPWLAFWQAAAAQHRP